jgi:hypothetical protein
MIAHTVYVTILNLFYTDSELPHLLAEYVAMFRDLKYKGYIYLFTYLFIYLIFNCNWVYTLWQ